MRKLVVNTGRVLHTMAGGIGASWHAIGPDAFWYDGLRSRHNRGARGSAFGGNPPLHMTDAWNDICAHARWLNFSFVRVEIDRRMFEPERRKFTFDSPEMRTLGRILDCCQDIGAEVFFTHMHADAAWNAYPGVNRLQSAPRSVADFAFGLGELLEYLIRRRRYTCLRWLCVSNEPGGAWGWWLGPEGKPVSVMPAVRAMRKELDRRKLDVTISGPDWCSLAQATDDYELDDPTLGALDAHIYGRSAFLPLMRRWTRRARARGVPFFLSEFGAWVGPNVFMHPNPEGDTVACYDAQLVNAQRVIGGLNIGVDGFNRWSFVNRGDLDGQFQLIRTWDRTRWSYFPRVTPETVPYYTYGILSRFMPKHAQVLRVQGVPAGVHAACVRGGRGEMTLYLLNTQARAMTMQVTWQGGDVPHGPLYQYQVTQRLLRQPGFALTPCKLSSASALRLPARSITAVSTLRK